MAVTAPMEQEKLRLLYRGSKDGFTAAAFWQRCKGKANTLTIAKVNCSLRSAQLSSSLTESVCSLTSLLPICLLR